jgi:hypothetical protein
MVDDLDAIHDQWQAPGLSVTAIAEGRPHRSFDVADPDGHVLAVRDSRVVGPV